MNDINSSKLGERRPHIFQVGRKVVPPLPPPPVSASMVVREYQQRCPQYDSKLMGLLMCLPFIKQPVFENICAYILFSHDSVVIIFQSSTPSLPERRDPMYPAVRFSALHLTFWAVSGNHQRFPGCTVSGFRGSLTFRACQSLPADPHRIDHDVELGSVAQCRIRHTFTRSC